MSRRPKVVEQGRKIHMRGACSVDDRFIYIVGGVERSGSEIVIENKVSVFNVNKDLTYVSVPDLINKRF